MGGYFSRISRMTQEVHCQCPRSQIRSGDRLMGHRQDLLGLVFPADQFFQLFGILLAVCVEM